MSQSVQSQLYGLVIMMFFVGLGIVRRIRPQPVRIRRILIGGVLIAVFVLASLFGAGGRIVSDPLALLLIPVFLALGAALGYYLVSTMTFWKDERTGALWMRGGVLFALILLGTIVLRLGVRTVVYGSPFGSGAYGPGGGQRGLLYDLSADLLFLTLGLWGARSLLLYLRYRSHEAGATEPAAPQG
jgi:hypothetical protein